MAGRWFDQFEVGAIIDHEVRRTVTETDNVMYSTMTMNPAAIHLDYDYCARTEFGKPLVNSLFTLGLVVGLSVGETTLGTTVGNLGFEDVKFPKPVFYGDTIRAQTEIAAKRESKSRPTQGIVTFIHRGVNQRGEIVCECRRQALMMKKPA